MSLLEIHWAFPFPIKTKKKLISMDPSDEDSEEVMEVFGMLLVEAPRAIGGLAKDLFQLALVFGLVLVASLFKRCSLGEWIKSDFSR